MEQIKKYKADFHVHTVLSPCGDLDMSPIKLVEQAKKVGLDILGITDHNSTKHALLTQKIAARENIFVLCGAEITTKEEVHVLCFMPDSKSLSLLQEYIDTYLIKVENNVKLFGEQLVVNEDEEILAEEDYLLINAIDQNINQISEFVHLHQGIFIPAHIDRPAFSLLGQLGFIPPDLICDAFELWKTDSKKITTQFPYIKNSSFIRSSDAHFINDIGIKSTEFYLMERSFDEIKLALNQQSSRHCKIVES